MNKSQPIQFGQMIAFMASLALPMSISTGVFAQYSQFAPPTWYDYGSMRRQIIQGGIERDRILNDSGQNPPQSQGQSSQLDDSSGGSQDDSVSSFGDIKEAALGFYRLAAESTGIPPEELASAITAYVTTNYLIAIERDEDLPTNINQAIYRQLKQKLRNDKRFQAVIKKSSRDDLAVEAVLIYLTAQQAQQEGDAQTQAQIRKLARKNVETLFQASLNKIQITNNGIVVR